MLERVEEKGKNKKRKRTSWQRKDRASGTRISQRESGEPSSRMLTQHPKHNYAFYRRSGMQNHSSFDTELLVV